MFRFLLGFFVGWLACNWYVENGRSFDRAFGPLAQGAGEAFGEATRFAREMTEEDDGESRGRSTQSAARRARRAASS